MDYHQDQEDTYYRVLQYLKKLLKRQNLCHNTYLYKKMKDNLTVPLQIITNQMTVASISRNYDLIIDALENTGLAHVVDGKIVRIIEHPTIKLNINDHMTIREIQSILEQKEVKYEISKRFDYVQYMNLTIFSQNIQWLEGLIRKIQPSTDFLKANLIEDIKFGVDRIRKLKFEHAKQKTSLGKVKYSLMSPPEIFVRKALQSSDEEQELVEIEKTKNQKNGKVNGNGNVKKRHKIKGEKQARIKQDDFPILAQSN